MTPWWGSPIPMQTRAPKPCGHSRTPRPSVQPPDQGQTWTPRQASPALSVKSIHHVAVATFDHTIKDLAHWEAGVSRGLEARKWGEHPKGTRSDTTEDTATAWTSAPSPQAPRSPTETRETGSPNRSTPSALPSSRPLAKVSGDAGRSMPSPRHRALSELRAITRLLLRCPANPPLYSAHTGDTDSSHH